MENLNIEVADTWLEKIFSMRRSGLPGGGKADAKPVYMCTLLYSIYHGIIRDNKFYFNVDLRDLYNSLFRKLSKRRAQEFNLPYYHLSSEDYYSLEWVNVYGKIDNKSCTPSSSFLTKNLKYAHFSEELWNLLKQREYCCYFLQSIIEHYFPSKSFISGEIVDNYYNIAAEPS